MFFNGSNKTFQKTHVTLLQMHSFMPEKPQIPLVHLWIIDSEMHKHTSSMRLRNIICYHRREKCIETLSTRVSEAVMAAALSINVVWKKDLPLCPQYLNRRKLSHCWEPHCPKVTKSTIHWIVLFST